MIVEVYVLIMKFEVVKNIFDDEIYLYFWKYVKILVIVDFKR